VLSVQFLEPQLEEVIEVSSKSTVAKIVAID